MSPDVVVVGAGLAGLACASDLVAAGLDVVVLEASDGVGGRVRTDALDGYLLDRGFQVLSTSYPEVHRRLRIGDLECSAFESGALVRRGGRFHVVADPLRQPGLAWSTLTAPIGTILDKARLARLVLDVRRHGVPDLLRRPDCSTRARLEHAGFSSRMVEAFWRPLFAGIDLDPTLEVSARLFDTFLRTLATGESVLPRRGMGAIPAQLAACLPAMSLRLSARVETLGAGGVTLADGEQVVARCVVVATDGPGAHRLLSGRVRDPGSRPVACCWFKGAGAPPSGRALLLDGDGSGPAPNVAFVSAVAPSYAPPGRFLVAAAVPGPEAFDDALARRVASQLARWFGSTTRDWDLLRVDVVAHGQPDQRPPFSPQRRVTLGEGVFVCGDHRDTASIQGALYSGGRCAAAVFASLGARGGRPAGL